MFITLEKYCGINRQNLISNENEEKNILILWKAVSVSESAKWEQFVSYLKNDHIIMSVDIFLC